MASTVLGWNLGSGAQPLISGNVWSGQGGSHPVGGIQFRWDSTASGRCYIYLSGATTPVVSGGPTITSGVVFLSGQSGGGPQVGGMDGMYLNPGDPYFVPRLAFGTSGQVSVCALCDAAASGQGRLWWEFF